MKRIKTTGTGKYENLLAACRKLSPVSTAVAHPCEESALVAAIEAAEAGLIRPHVRDGIRFFKNRYDGLRAYALTVQGRGVKDSFDENETDLNLQWTPKKGALKGFSFRTRYAVVDQRGSNGDTLDDFRLIVNYDF